MSNKSDNSDGWAPFVGNKDARKKVDNKFSALIDIKKEEGDGFVPIQQIDDDKLLQILQRGNVKGAQYHDELTEEEKKEALDKGFAEGMQKGIEEGEKKGFEQGLKKAEEKANKMQEVVFGIENLWKELIKNYEKQLIEIICKISEKVVYAKVELDHEVVKRAILNAFEIISDPVEAVINVSSEDYNFIETVKNDFFKQIEGLKQLSIVSNSSISSGGCKIELKTGEIDSRIETRFEVVKKAVLSQYGR